MANGTGQTYGRFSGRTGTGGSNRVMQVAKQMGARKRAFDEQEAWRIKFDDWLAKKGKARNVGSIIDIASMFLLPQIKGLQPLAKGAKGAGIVDKLWKGGAKTLGGMGAGSIGTMLAETLSGVGSMPQYSSTFDPYSVQYTDQFKREASEQERDYNRQLQDFIAGKWGTHAMAGFGGEGGIAEWLLDMAYGKKKGEG